MVESLLLMIPATVVTAADLDALLVDRPGQARETTSMEDAELAAIRQALAASGDNMSEAARLLGVSRSTLYRKQARLRAQRQL